MLSRIDQLVPPPLTPYEWFKKEIIRARAAILSATIALIALSTLAYLVVTGAKQMDETRAIVARQEQISGDTKKLVAEQQALVRDVERLMNPISEISVHASFTIRTSTLAARRVRLWKGASREMHPGQRGYQPLVDLSCKELDVMPGDVVDLICDLRALCDAKFSLLFVVSGEKLGLEVGRAAYSGLDVSSDPEHRRIQFGIGTFSFRIKQEVPQSAWNGSSTLKSILDLDKSKVHVSVPRDVCPEAELSYMTIGMRHNFLQLTEPFEPALSDELRGWIGIVEVAASK